MNTFKKFRIPVIAFLVFVAAMVAGAWHPTFTYENTCETYKVNADPMWNGYPGIITADSGNLSGSWGSSTSVTGWIKVKWLDKDGKVLHPESTYNWEAKKDVQSCTPTATSTPTDVPTSTPTPSVTPTEPPITQTPPPTVTATATLPPPDGGFLCAVYLPYELKPAHYAQIWDGTTFVYWPGYTLVNYKAELGLWEVALWASHGSLNTGLFLISGAAGEQTIKVEVGAGNNCHLVTEVAVAATPVPFAGDCDPSHLMAGAISCDQEIKVVVLAYCVGNPDPALTISGVQFEQVVRATVRVNGEAVTSVVFWKGENVVNGRWVYEDIKAGDTVQIGVTYVGLTEEYNVPVIEGHACGNPAIQAMIGPNGGLFAYPGQGPDEVKEILNLTSDEKALEIWEEAHRNTQLGIETMLN